MALISFPLLSCRIVVNLSPPSVHCFHPFPRWKCKHCNNKHARRESYAAGSSTSRLGEHLLQCAKAPVVVKADVKSRFPSLARKDGEGTDKQTKLAITESGISLKRRITKTLLRCLIVMFCLTPKLAFWALDNPFFMAMVAALCGEKDASSYKTYERHFTDHVVPDFRQSVKSWLAQEAPHIHLTCDIWSKRAFLHLDCNTYILE